MTKEQMIDRYNELYMKMATSKDPKNMKIFGESEKWVFVELAKIHPEMAQNWLSHLEAVCWNNYMDEKQASNVSKRTVNQDGVKGFHWTYDVFTKAVESLGGVVEENPYYNSYALWVTANMIYSDHASSIAADMNFSKPTEVPNEKMALSCYRKAVELLKDPDEGYKAQVYFRGKMYETSPM